MGRHGSHFVSDIASLKITENVGSVVVEVEAGVGKVVNLVVVGLLVVVKISTSSSVAMVGLVGVV